jgi:hypothetical protein
MNVHPATKNQTTKVPGTEDGTHARSDQAPANEPPDSALERHDTIPAPTWMGDEPEPSLPS